MSADTEFFNTEHERWHAKHERYVASSPDMDFVVEGIAIALTSLASLHRKVNTLQMTQSADDAALLAADTALKTQIANFTTDITNGLAQIQAKLQASGSSDPTVESVTADINTMGTGLAGSQAAFDAVVAGIANPQAPAQPVTAPVTAPATGSTTPPAAS